MSAVWDLSGKAKNAVTYVSSILYRFESHSLVLFVQLFDSHIQPILLYGAEVWAVYCSQAYIDTLQSFALKRFLGVDQTAPNDMVVGDTGRYPLQVTRSKTLAKNDKNEQKSFATQSLEHAYETGRERQEDLSHRNQTVAVHSRFGFLVGEIRLSGRLPGS